MGRKRHGPVRINDGLTWYARLHIPNALRAQAGKTRLIRSLQTTDHNTALKRYGTVLTALEDELGRLLTGTSLKDAVEANRKGLEGYTELQSLPPVEMAEAILSVRELDFDNPVHKHVVQALSDNKPLSITWDELLNLWIKERNTLKSRDLSDSSIRSAQNAIDEIKEYCLYPCELTKVVIRKWIEESTCKPTTIQQKFRLLSAMYNVGIYSDALVGVEYNPFKQVRYAASTKADDSRLPFSDEQLATLWEVDSPVKWLVLTGLRPGEYVTRDPEDLVNGMINVCNKPGKSWRTKNVASIRRVPMPEGFELMKPLSHITLGTYIRTDTRKLFNNKRLTPHSGRHTFYELSRRAGCESLVIEAVAGHAQKRQSSQYGAFTDEVMKRECRKLWEFVEQIIRK